MKYFFNKLPDKELVDIFNIIFEFKL